MRLRPVLGEEESSQPGQPALHLCGGIKVEVLTGGAIPEHREPAVVRTLLEGLPEGARELLEGLCGDPRHVLALDGVAVAVGEQIGKSVWALRKKPEIRTGTQRTALAGIAADNKPLDKGYLIKEQLCEAFKVKER